MNFYDIVEGMGYNILINDKDIIEIVNSEKILEIHIVFYRNDKKILGYIKPLDNIYDIENVSHLYAKFLEMERDVKNLAARSKYDII